MNFLKSAGLLAGGCFCFAVASACSVRPAALPNPSQVELTKVAHLPGYTEGIAFDAAGTAYVSAGRDPQQRHAVYKIVPGERPEAWLDLRIPNGHKVLRDGTHVVAAEGTVVHVARDGQLLDSLVMDTQGVVFRRPNDIALDGHNGFYFTDPGPGNVPARNGRVFYSDSTDRIWTAHEGLCYPNGLIVRADGRALYVDDSCDGRVYRIPITAPGTLGPAEVLATIPDSADAGLDGIALDRDGRLYIAHNGVGLIEVLDPSGRPLGRYAAGNRLASNVAFDGPGLGDLYVTGSPGEKFGPGAVYRLRLGVRGRGSMATPAP
jgi:gluconolactonase